MWDIIPKRDERKDIINKRIMKKKAIIPFLALLLSQLLFSQVQLTSSTNALRHGDFLCRVEVPYANEGQRGEGSVWMLPEIPDDSHDYFQSILSNGDTIVIYEEGRMQHFLVRGDTLYNKGEQSRRAYKIYSSERPELTYPFLYGDSLAGCYEGDCLYLYPKKMDYIIYIDIQEMERILKLHSMKSSINNYKWYE